MSFKFEQVKLQIFELELTAESTMADIDGAIFAYNYRIQQLEP